MTRYADSLLLSCHAFWLYSISDGVYSLKKVQVNSVIFLL